MTQRLIIDRAIDHGTVAQLLCRDERTGRCRVIFGDIRPLRDFVHEYFRRVADGEPHEFTENAEDGHLYFLEEEARDG